MHSKKKKKKRKKKKKNVVLCFSAEICHGMSLLKAQVIFPSHFAPIFSTIKHKSSVLFLAQRLYTLVKISPLKCKFLRFLSAQVKFVKFLMSILNWQSIPIQFLHHSSLPRRATPLQFLSSYIFNFRQKNTIRVSILRLSYDLVKICQIPHVIFQTTSQFFFKFCITL